jgi:hypothetical protein
MKWFSFTSAKVVDAFANELAKEFARRYPLSGNAATMKKTTEKQIERTMEELFAKAKAFKVEHRLGIFKRARLAKTFQDELRKLGYDPGVVNKVTTGLVTSVLSGR